MGNKKIFLTSLLALLLLPLAIYAADAEPSVRVTLLKTDPSPAEPGKFVDVWITIENKGPGQAKNYVIELAPEYPFLLDKSQDPVLNYPLINIEPVSAKYKIRIAEDAPNGDGILKLKHYSQGSQSVIKEELKIPILGKLDANIVSVEPENLVPGKSTKVKFTISNAGKSAIKDLVVLWDDPKDKILPIGEENRKKIHELSVEQSTALEFNMIADPSIIQGVHLINVNMTFQRFGSTDTRSTQIAFIVGGLAEFDVAQQEIEDSALSLSIANIGVNTATGVLVSLPEQEGWKQIGGSGVFLGNLNPGDFTVASFQLEPVLIVSQKESAKKIKVKIDYTDTTGSRQSAEKEISINLAKPSLQKTKERPNYLFYGFIAVVIMAVLWYFLKHGRKKSSEANT